MKNNTKKPIIPIIFIVLYITLFIGLTIASLFHSHNYTTNTKSAEFIKNVSLTYNEETKECKLPYKLNKLSPRSNITVKYTLRPKEYNFLYVKTVYAPLKVYADDNLMYEFGTEGSYAKFMIDPPTKVKIVELPHSNKETHIKIEYKAPIDRNSLIIHPFIYGGYSSILDRLFVDMGFIFTLGLTYFILGIVFVIVGLVVMTIEKKSISFIWLGLFALFTGLFSLGECNLTQLYIHNASLLYIIDFCSFMILPIPLVQFGMSIIDFRNKKSLQIAQFIQILCSCVAIFLQVFSIKSLSSSLYLFIVLSPIMLIYFAICILREAFHGSKEANNFIFPTSIVALSAVIEAINYRFRFVNTLSSCFLVGVLIFTTIISIQCIFYLHKLILIKQANRELEYEIALLEKQMESQDERNQMVLKNVEKIKTIRHDLRHQLAVIQHYNSDGDTEKLDKYLNTLIDSIPSEKSYSFCSNQAVNAIIIYYLKGINDKNIDTEIKLDIPDSLDNIEDSDLCIIIGNLIENAIEACDRLDSNEKKYITLRSHIQYDTLTITQDNSFNGDYTMVNDTFMSSKRNEPGIGINSIKKVVEKYNGGYKFEGKDKRFMSSIYIKL